MTNTLDSIIVGLQSYVVAPLNAFGIGGLVFDVVGESIAQLNAEITDHYTEDNRALQDHMAIRPKRITLKGYVGELVYGDSGQNNSFVQTLTQKLTVVSSFLPLLSAAATQMQSAGADPLASTLTLSSTANIYSVVKNSLGAFGNSSKQQNAYSFFQALQSQAILMGIQTPWEFLTNMAIESIVAIQNEETRDITDFSVTFKQIRIATTQSTAYSPPSSNPTAPQDTKSLQGAAALQSEPPNKIGIVSGLDLPYSGLPGAQGIMQGVSDFVSGPLSSLWK